MWFRAPGEAGLVLGATQTFAPLRDLKNKYLFYGAKGIVREGGILCTGITEGMAVGSAGCPQEAVGAGGWFITGCCHLSVEVPNDKRECPSKRRGRQKRENTEGPKEKQVRYFLSGNTLW